jgi:hypothetical protein
MGGQFTTDCSRPKPTTRLVVIAEKIKVGSVGRSKPSSLTFLAPLVRPKTPLWGSQYEQATQWCFPPPLQNQ